MLRSVILSVLLCSVAVLSLDVRDGQKSRDDKILDTQSYNVSPSLILGTANVDYSYQAVSLCPFSKTTNLI